MLRVLTPRQLAFDIVLAGFCLFFRATLGFESLEMAVVVFVMATALALRRLSPPLALAIAWVGAAAQMASLLNPDASNLAILAVLYSTARYGSERVKWLGLVSAIGGAFVAVAYLYFQPFGFNATLSLSVHLLPTIVFTTFAALSVLGLSWTLGLLVKTWSTAIDTRRAQLKAEKTVVVEQERNRIARDMHDVVAHSLAVVIAQADGARYALDSDPDAAKNALATISSTSREALADVRLLLTQLRHNQEAGPQPTLADLGRLVEQLRDSGLAIDFQRSGTPPALPMSHQLAIYRIVQEALTNALRHGDPGKPVTARLDWTVDAGALTISNAVRPGAPEPAGSGHGLAGMTERAQLVGGAVSARRVGDTFVVSASIPAPIEEFA
jgi:signal transduction histidine kinase